MTSRLCRICGLALAAVLVFAVPLWAMPPRPFTVGGKLVVNGQNAAEGTVVAAWCGGVQYASEPVEFSEGESWYVLDVPGDDPDEEGKDGCYSGEAVSFTVNGFLVDQDPVPWSGDYPGTYPLGLTVFQPLPQLDLEVSTNGQDADSAPGPEIVPGGTVTWTYHIANTGNVTLTNVTVVDDRLGEVCAPGTLPVDASTACTRTGTAAAGQYANAGTASGVYTHSMAITDTVLIALPASDSDPSHYLGVEPGIDLEVRTNGLDADAPPGPYIAVGETVTWSYLVENTGNVALSGIAVTDDRLGAVSCPGSALAAGASMTCTATGTAQGGKYANLGTAVGYYGGQQVSDQDPSHYYSSFQVFLPTLLR